MALVFDFDGVLVDTRDDNITAINAFAHKYDFPPMDVDAYTRMLEHNFTEYWQMLLGTRTSEFFRDLHHYPRPHPRLVPGMVEILRAHQPAIVSSNASHLILRVLRDNGITLPVYGVDDNPSKVVKLTRLRAEPNVFVTDTTGDVVEGKRAGYFVVAVTWGFTPLDTLRRSQPHAIVHSPQELAALLARAHEIVIEVEIPKLHERATAN